VHTLLPSKNILNQHLTLSLINSKEVLGVLTLITSLAMTSPLVQWLKLNQNINLSISCLSNTYASKFPWEELPHYSSHRLRTSSVPKKERTAILLFRISFTRKTMKRSSITSLKRSKRFKHVDQSSMESVWILIIFGRFLSKSNVRQYIWEALNSKKPPYSTTW